VAGIWDCGREELSRRAFGQRYLPPAEINRRQDVFENNCGINGLEWMPVN